jgi:hypothetical protein
MSEARLARIEENVLKLVEITARNTTILDEHQRRSVASEARLDILEKDAYIRHKSVKITLWAIPIIVSIILGVSRFI